MWYFTKKLVVSIQEGIVQSQSAMITEDDDQLTRSSILVGSSIAWSLSLSDRSELGARNGVSVPGTKMDSHFWESLVTGRNYFSGFTIFSRALSDSAGTNLRPENVKTWNSGENGGSVPASFPVSFTAKYRDLPSFWA